MRRKSIITTQCKTPKHKYTDRVSVAVKLMSWPKGASSTIHKAVNDSLLSYDKWIKSLRSVVISNQRLSQFREYLLAAIPNECNVITSWFIDIHRRISWRRDFSGDLTKHTWRPNHPRWVMEMRGYADEWCGDNLLWFKLNELLDDKP